MHSFKMLSLVSRYSGGALSEDLAISATSAPPFTFVPHVCMHISLWQTMDWSLSAGTDSCGSGEYWEFSRSWKITFGEWEISRERGDLLASLSAMSSTLSKPSISDGRHVCATREGLCCQQRRSKTRCLLHIVNPCWATTLGMNPSPWGCKMPHVPCFRYEGIQFWIVLVCDGWDAFMCTNYD